MHVARAIVTAALSVIAIALGCGVEPLDLTNKRCPCDESAGYVCDTPSQKCILKDCTGKTCQALGVQCGAADDGCGRFLDCDELLGCVPGREVCVGNKCVCTPNTCASAHAQCGSISDGCGGDNHDCGTCPSGQQCGGGGDHVCGANPCVPKKTCLAGDCGAVSDGCNGSLQCDPPKTCANYEGQCGTLSNGCGGSISCACQAPRRCTEGKCCYTCESLEWQCGDGPDGCGGVVRCGGCEAGACNTTTHRCVL
jgi:hypothetical protein